MRISDWSSDVCSSDLHGWAMTDFAPLLQPDRGESAHTLRLVDAKTFDGWLKAQPQRVAAAVAAPRFAGKGYGLANLPSDKDADDRSTVLGVAHVGKLTHGCLSKARERPPQGACLLA